MTFYEEIMNNINKKRNTERAFRESEEKYRQLVDMLPEAIVVHRNGEILYVNPSGIRLFGAEGVNFPGKPLLDFVHPDFHAKVLARIRKTATERTPAPIIEEKLLRLNGDAFDAEVTGTSIDYEGKPATMALIRDISESRQAAIALAESESKFRMLAESTTVGIFLFREHFLYANPEFSEMCGYSQEQLLQMGIADLLHPDSLNEVQRNWELRKQGDAAPGYCDIKFIAKGGEVRWGQLTTALITFEGLPTSVGSITDITDLKQAEHDIKESEQRLSRIITDAPIPVMVHAEDGEILMLSRKWTELTGYSHVDIPNIKTWIARAYDKDKQEAKRILKALYSQNSMEKDGEFTIRTADGDKRTWNFHSSSLGTLSDNRHFIVSMATDITIMRQREEAILSLSNENRRLAQQLLHVQEQERQDLARELHDALGQSLTLIKTELGRVISHNWNRKELTGIIKTINEATDQVIATTRGMLQRLRPGMLDSVGLIGALSELAKKWEEQQGIACTFDSSGDLKKLNEDIQLALYRVAQESLTNIARHARARQVQVHCHRRKPSGDGDNRRDAVTLIVTDDGVGLPGKRKSQQELGLIGMRERAHAIGGKFNIESVPNKGVRITVTIPMENETRS